MFLDEDCLVCYCKYTCDLIGTIVKNANNAAGFLL